MGRNGFILEHGKDAVQTIPDQVVEDHDVIFIAIARKDHKTVDSFGDLDHGIAFFLFGPILPAAVAAFEDHLNGQVGCSIFQHGKFGEVVQDDGHQLWTHILDEIVPDKSLIFIGYRGLIDPEDILRLQFLFYIAQDFEAFGLLIDAYLCDFLQQVFGFGTAKDAFPGPPRLCNPLDRSIANLKKFVEVVGKDTQKPEPLDHGDILVGTFLKDTFVKSQPTDLPVYILVFGLNHYLSSFGKIKRVVVPPERSAQVSVSNVRCTSPVVGTLSISLFPR